MSVRVMSAVWDTADVSGAKLLLLLALADNANDDGEYCRGDDVNDAPAITRSDTRSPS
jgi:hypothetical protein